jgi:hypothetical protein
MALSDIMAIETMSDTVICETRACEARAPLDYLLADILRAQDLSPSSSSFESSRDDVHTATDKDRTRVKQLTRQMSERSHIKVAYPYLANVSSFVEKSIIHR